MEQQEIKEKIEAAATKAGQVLGTAVKKTPSFLNKLAYFTAAAVVATKNGFVDGLHAADHRQEPK